jgi:hypothetical protein
LWLSSFSQGDTLAPEEFSTILRNNFTTIANNNPKTTIGNFASANTKEGTLNFNASGNFKNGNFLSVNASGSIDNDVFNLFSGTKGASGVSFEAKYSFISGREGIGYVEGSASALHYKIKGEKQSAGYSNDYKKLERFRDSLKLVSLINSTKMQALQKQTQADSIALEMKLDSLHIELYKVLSKESYDVLVQKSFKSSKKYTNTLLEEFEITDISYGWFSIAAGMSNNTFRQFNSSFLALDSQLTKQTYTSFHGSLEYNYFHWNHVSSPSFYLLIGVSGFISDNFGDLGKTEITDVTVYGDSSLQRTITKKQTVYMGDYQKDLVGGKIYLDYYQMFNNNKMGFHLFPEAVYRQSSVPVYNGGIGLLYSFIKQEDKNEKEKVNVELYYKFIDITNSKNSDASSFKRNEISLRVSVPIAFFNL